MMKHTLKVTLIILGIFLLAQLVGLYVTDHFSIQDQLPMNIERPEVSETGSFFTLLIFIFLATALALLLIKFALFKIWKFWFLLSVFFTLTVTWSAFMWEWLAIVLAIIFALLKIFRPTPLVHNFTEIFIYGALAAIFVPLLNLLTVSLLLIAISIYDYIAVRKTKHMVKLAKSQSKAQIFAGILIPYGKKKVAMLGGGDIGIPLLFGGVVMKTFGFGLLDPRTYIVPLFAALALFYLFYTADKKKFYPAMPYVSAGCFIALALIYLIQLF